MQRRMLGNTGVSLPLLSFGASSVGAEFRSIDLQEALASVRTALDLGMNFIDTAAYYGRGSSEVLLGFALQDVPRDSYLLASKLGRYDRDHFDYSAKRVAESIDVSLHRLRTDYLDFILCHDIEFGSLEQIVEETLPAVRRAQQAGKVRFVGISGYPLKIFDYVLSRTDLDFILSFNQYQLQNRRLTRLVPQLKPRGIGIMNAGPFCARLLTNQELPAWHVSSPQVRAAAREAAQVCSAAGVDIAKLALQFSVANPDFATCIVGSANPKNVQNWARWIEEPLDQELLAKVEAIFAPVMDEGPVVGRPENN